MQPKTQYSKRSYSMAAAKPPCSFPTPESLSDWLKARLPAEVFASWGIKPATKNVYNLWIELNQGESMIFDTTPPLRSVHCAVVRILSEDKKKILLESHRELSDGSKRRRSLPLSEKMTAGESIEAATLRAVKEELGQKLNDHGSIVTKIVPGSCKIKEEERELGSFPGLASAYVVQTVDAHVEGLPPGEDGEFYTEEEEYKECSDGLNGAVEKAVHVKRHYWKWADALCIEEIA